MKAGFKDHQGQEEKLEDILRSIRGMIDGHHQDPSNNNHKSFKSAKPEDRLSDKVSKIQDQIQNKLHEYANDDNDLVLELTDVVQEGKSWQSERIVSREVLNQSSKLVRNFADSLGDKVYARDDRLEGMVVDLLKPLLKDWLDNNLLKIVEKIVADELKNLVPRK